MRGRGREEGRRKGQARFVELKVKGGEKKEKIWNFGDGVGAFSFLVEIKKSSTILGVAAASTASGVHKQSRLMTARLKKKKKTKEKRLAGSLSV